MLETETQAFTETEHRKICMYKFKTNLMRSQNTELVRKRWRMGEQSLQTLQLIKIKSSKSADCEHVQSL